MFVLIIGCGKSSSPSGQKTSCRGPLAVCIPSETEEPKTDTPSTDTSDDGTDEDEAEEDDTPVVCCNKPPVIIIKKVHYCRFRHRHCHLKHK